MLILKVSKKLTKAPFKIYSGYECLLICSTDNINFGWNTKKEKDQGRIVCSYNCKVICVDEKYRKPYKTYIDEDAMNKFLNDITKKSGYCSWNRI